MKSFVIKVCGVTTPDDVLAAVDAGATAIGFNFYHRSPRFVTVSQARELSALVPAGVDKVGVFVASAGHDWQTVQIAIQLDVIQVHGGSTVLPPPTQSSVRLWQALPVTEEFQPVSPQPGVEAYLLDAPSKQYGGSGKTFNWSLAAIDSVRVILAGGLEASNVGQAIRVSRPWGVDACSRLESSPGIKDPRKVKAFVEAARAVFLELALNAEAALAKETV